MQPIAEAPALEELLLVDMGHLSAEAVRPFRGHPQLRWAVVGLGSIRKNEVAKQLIGVPTADRAIEFVFQ